MSSSGDHPGGRRGERRGSRAHQGRTHEVRPRRVWLALLLMVLGAVVAGLGLMGVVVAGPAWATVAAGVALLVVGGLLGLRGGFFYDIAGGEDPGRIAADIREGVVLEGPDPRDRTAAPDVARRARETEQLALALRHAAREPASLARLGGWLTTGSGVLLVLAQGAFADSPAGPGPSFRALGAGVLLLLAGLRISLARSAPAGVVAALLGALVAASTLLADDLPVVAVGLSLVAAALALVGGALALDRRT